jgi:hypothetical protein
VSAEAGNIIDADAHRVIFSPKRTQDAVSESSPTLPRVAHSGNLLVNLMGEIIWLLLRPTQDPKAVFSSFAGAIAEDSALNRLPTRRPAVREDFGRRRGTVTPPLPFCGCHPALRVAASCLAGAP